MGSSLTSRVGSENARGASGDGLNASGDQSGARASSRSAVAAADAVENSTCATNAARDESPSDPERFGAARTRPSLRTFSPCVGAS